MHEWRTRALAALHATGGVLSHVSALTVWRLARGSDPVHVSIPAGRRALRRPGLRVHRVQRLTADRIGPYPVTDLPPSLVDAWALAFSHPRRSSSVETGRAAVITTLRDRRVTAARLRAEIARRPALPGRRDLVELVALVESGCHSELEIWGVREVLDGPGMPAFVQQVKLVLPSREVWLDAAVPELKVAVEMDGAAFHGSAEDRERDTRRDVALTAAGWVVLRFSYRRLTTEPDACRREIISVCAARRAQLAGW
jgi:hypothetical protein